MNRILFADDMADEHTLWKRFHGDLEREVDKVFMGQCGLDTVFTFDEVLKRLDETEYDALILDLVIPPGGVNEGVEFIAEHAKKLPIIVLTGHEDIFVRRRCIVAGAAAFWTKKDAQRVPDIFFKCVYNEYVKRYVPTA